MVQQRIYDYFRRNPTLHVLFIFDRMDIIRTELEEADEWADDYVYRVFDGAWFNTKYAIEHTWRDRHVVLLFSTIAQPHTEADQLRFPLMDMLRANLVYQEEDYATFIQQHGLPQRLAPFLKRNMAEITSAKVSALLAGYIYPDTFSEDLVCRALLTSYLGEKSLMDWEHLVVGLLIVDGTGTEKRRTALWHRVGKNRDVGQALNARLEKLFGLRIDDHGPHKLRSVAESLKYNVIAYLIDPAPMDPYKIYKITHAPALVGVNQVYQTGIQDPDLRRPFAQALRALASGIREGEIFKVYGPDADYFQLTESLCWPILQNDVEKRLVAEPRKVVQRMRTLSLQMPEDSPAQAAIAFVHQAASYYAKARTTGTLRAGTPRAYVDQYVGNLYLVDTLYRHTLEAYHQLIDHDLPIDLHTVKQQIDQHYAQWANRLNLEWLTCVNATGTYFAETGLIRQDHFYDAYADPGMKQVVIVSDALRYEVAAELMQALSRTKHTATLTPCLAMLPTETKYDKPALLPHGKLELSGGDLAVDGQVLTTTDHRTAHLQKYRPEGLCVRYEDVMAADQATLRRLFKRPLVYIFHDTIDQAGHGQNPFEVISACRKTIDQLSQLIRRLHATYNVTNVVLTSDHGFLYNDITFQEKDKHSPADEAVEKKTRYYLTPSARAVEGVAKFPLRQVSAIDSPLLVAVPIGTNRFSAPGGYSFAHGGASLQEMIIPVVRSRRKSEGKTTKVGLALLSHHLVVVSSRLKLKVIQTEPVGTTTAQREVACQLYRGDEAVSPPQKLMLSSTDPSADNRIHEVCLTLDPHVGASVVELRIYDVDDPLNPLVREPVQNNTLIEPDFF